MQTTISSFSSIKLVVLRLCLVLVFTTAMGKITTASAPTYAHSPLHEYYVSVCEIAHNPNTQSLEITFKIFTDDLETALKAQGADSLNIGTKKEHAKTDQYIFAYLQQQFSVRANKAAEALALQFVGKELEEDVTWCYVEITDLPKEKIASLQIENRLLMATFATQMNLVHVNYEQHKKSLFLHKGLVEDSVVF